MLPGRFKHSVSSDTVKGIFEVKLKEYLVSGQVCSTLSGSMDSSFYSKRYPESKLVGGKHIARMCSSSLPGTLF